jgi:hypothetical protein
MLYPEKVKIKWGKYLFCDTNFDNDKGLLA